MRLRFHHILYMIFQEKYFACYILLTDQISLPGCLFEILRNKRFVIIFCPVCELIHFEIKDRFLIKLFLHNQKGSTKM